MCYMSHLVAIDRKSTHKGLSTEWNLLAFMCGKWPLYPESPIRLASGIAESGDLTDTIFPVCFSLFPLFLFVYFSFSLSQKM